MHSDLPLVTVRIVVLRLVIEDKAHQTCIHLISIAEVVTNIHILLYKY